MWRLNRQTKEIFVYINCTTKKTFLQALERTIFASFCRRKRQPGADCKVCNFVFSFRRTSKAEERSAHPGSPSGCTVGVTASHTNTGRRDMDKTTPRVLAEGLRFPEG